MKPRAQALISRGNLFHNLSFLAERTRADLLLPVKANAYGHGIQEVARLAMEHEKVWGLAVGTPEEAWALKDCVTAGTRVVLLGAALPDEVAELAALGIRVAVVNWEQARALPTGAKAHLKVNTGMNRLGLKPQEALKVGLYLSEKGQLEGVWTHFAESDNPDLTRTHEALTLFKSVAEQLPAEYYHVANGGAALSLGALEGMSLVRPGLAIYGYSPALHLQHSLKPVMSFRARVVAFQEVERGERVSYGGLWEAPEARKIAVIGAGYADGYPRGMSKGEVMVAGERRPIVGRVCMDQLMVDVTGLYVKLGDWVELWGEEISLSDISHHTGIIEYELLTGVGLRVQRMII